MPRREGIRSLLADYPVPLAEGTAYRLMQELVEHRDDPLARSTFDPGHFTGSGFVLSPACDAVLLVHHSKLSRWLQPGGHVDPADPTVLDAAHREVLEETGLDVSPLVRGVFDIDVHVYPAGREPEHSHFDIRFLFGSDTVDVPGSDEIDDWRWVELDRIGEVTDDDSLLRPFAKVAEWVGSGAV